MNIVFEVWRLLDRRQRRSLVALQFLSVLMAFSTVGGIAAVLPFFSVLADPGAVAHSAVLRFCYEHLHATSERDFVIVLGVAFAVGIVLANLVNLVGTLLMTRFAYQVGDAFYIALFDEYLHRSYRFHSLTNSSTLVTNVVHETGRVTGGILQSGLVFVTNMVTIGFIVVSLVVVNPLIAVSAISGLGAGYAAVYAIARRHLLRNGRAESRYYAQRNSVVTEGFGAIKEIIISRAQHLFVANFTRYCAVISRAALNNLAVAQSPRYVLESAAVCALIGVALYLSGRAESGPWMAQLTFFGLAAYRLLPALQQAFGAIVRIRADRPAFDNIAGDLRQAKARNAGVGAAVPASSWRGRPRDEIRLEAVSLRHGADRPAALTDVTLTIPARNIVGFVGANGSGKTTLIDVLGGLLVPDSGRVWVDGIELDDGNRAAWQTTVAYVPQHTFLLDCTLAENIALGVSPTQIDRERVRMAAGLARLDECVAALGKGYDEILGERGIRLSGGQRQRVGIARALYRDASVLIMDEATSALDNIAEREIAELLLALGRERTIIVIAHRAGTLRHCDLIFEPSTGATYGVLKPGGHRFFITIRK